jgi:hypothetical protein
MSDPKLYGCVQFDVVQNDQGKWQALPGPGWASVGGATAVRIQGLKDLNLDVLWLSNLEQTVHWAAGLFNTPQIKDNRYLRVRLDQIGRELGISPKVVSPAHSAEGLAEVFSRIMMLARQHWPQVGWLKSSLMQELSVALGIDDQPYEDPLLEEVFALSYQDIVECAKHQEGERYITFQRPRLLHARQLIGESGMLPAGNWSFVGERDMPKKEARLQWVMTAFAGRPFMVKVKKINFYRRLEEESFDASYLLKLGESILPGRMRRQREWMPMPELLYVSKYADVEFDSVCLGSHYDEDVGVGLPPLHEAMDYSYSWGLLAENVWMTYASRSINTKAKSKTLVSPRATWLRSYDRFYSFASAQHMSLPSQTKVLSYGVGGVTLAVKDPDLGVVIQHGLSGGLVAPASSYRHWKYWQERETKALAERQKILKSAGQEGSIVAIQNVASDSA